MTVIIDWPKVMRLLRKYYGSMEKVGTEIGADPATLRRLERAEVLQPKFEAGIKLLDLALDNAPIDQYAEVWKGARK